MQEQLNYKKINDVYRMLLEMATGNLSFRIEVKNNRQQIDKIANTLNNLAEKMQYSGFYHPNFKNEPPGISAKENTILIAEKTQKYILNHLDEPLPSTNELSKIIGTNEFALKKSFREILNTSVYQYYNDERLKRSHYLIQHTNESLKDIAFMCGFNGYTNFFKAFKKKYGYTPRDLSLNSQESVSE